MPRVFVSSCSFHSLVVFKIKKNEQLVRMGRFIINVLLITIVELSCPTNFKKWEGKLYRLCALFNMNHISSSYIQFNNSTKRLFVYIIIFQFQWTVNSDLHSTTDVLLISNHPPIIMQNSGIKYSVNNENDDDSKISCRLFLLLLLLSAPPLWLLHLSLPVTSECRVRWIRNKWVKWVPSFHDSSWRD